MRADYGLCGVDGGRRPKACSERTRGIGDTVYGDLKVKRRPTGLGCGVWRVGAAGTADEGGLLARCGLQCSGRDAGDFGLIDDLVVATGCERARLIGHRLRDASVGRRYDGGH